LRAIADVLRQNLHAELVDVALADAPAPSPEFMREILPPLGRMLAAANLRAGDAKAGCGKCGACSSLAGFEV